MACPPPAHHITVAVFDILMSMSQDSFWSLVYDAYYTTSSTGPKGSKWNNTNKQTPSSAGGGGSSRGGARAGRSAGTEAGFSSPSFPGSGRSSRAVSVTSDFVFANRAIKGSAEEVGVGWGEKSVHKFVYIKVWWMQRCVCVFLSYGRALSSR